MSRHLTPEEVKGIRAYLAVHTWHGAQLQIARKYGCSAATVNRIWKKKSYRVIPDTPPEPEYPVTNKICRWCKWYKPVLVTGDCRRYPPHPHPSGERGGLFPIVRRDWSCGEFAASDEAEELYSSGGS